MVYAKTFPCGLKFAFKRTRSAVAYCALCIKSGTGNEPGQFAGMAHLTEHMLFKGTEKRSASEISNRLERLGGELNAYTTKDETVLYSTVLKEDVVKAVDLLFEMAFTSRFEQKELEKERSVVIDEINMYKDSPADTIFDDFEKFLYGSHRLSKPILGDAKSLKKIESEDIRAYVAENFIPANMCISIVGRLSPQRAEKIALSALEKYVPQPQPRPERQIPPLKDGPLSAGCFFTKDISKKNHQVNCIIGATSYSFYDSERLTMILLNNILGGPCSNSRLNQELREKNALVYNVECLYTQYADTGSFLIYFGCDKSNLDRCLELIHKEISVLREKKLSEKALRDAKKQLLGQIAISSDSGENQALSMGKSMLLFGKIMPDEEVRARINAITAEGLMDVASKVMAPERLSTLIYR